MDKNRYPTVVAFGPTDHGNMADAIQTFVDSFGWRRMVALHDTMTNFPGLSTFYQVHVGNLKKRFDAATGKYDIRTHTFDSKVTTTYEKLLLAAVNESRGKLPFAF